MKTNGTVFNVQRFTVHDGPGIRTEFFLKGCPLRCDWCGNPESFKKVPQIGVYPTRCIGVSKCGDCVKACHNGKEIFEIVDDQIVSINRDLCDNCLKCYDECPSDALKLWGEKMSVDDAMEIILKDKKFFEKNNGGVTISGGESLLQPEFVRDVFKRCKDEGIHTCVETALHVSESALDIVMPYTDMVITDIKHMNNEIHKKRTGVSNENVLKNIKKLISYNKQLILRIPVIPDFNDNEKDIEDIGNFVLKELDNKVIQLQMLRYRPLGQEKYKAIGMDYKMEVSKERADFENEIRAYVEMLKQKGINAVAGATNKIDL